MEVQPTEIGFYFLVVGVIRDWGLEPGGESSEFFSTARRANDGCTEWRVFLRGEGGGNEIRESGTIFERVPELFLRATGRQIGGGICGSEWT